MSCKKKSKKCSSKKKCKGKVNGDIFYTSNASGSFQIWAINPAGTNNRQITSTVDNAIQPAISPCGKRLSFAGYTGTTIDIYICNVDGTNLINLTKGLAGEQNTNPSFSKNGKKITFQSNRLNPSAGTTDIWIMKSNGVCQEAFTPFYPTYSDIYPKYSPSKKRILFSSNRGSSSLVYDLYLSNNKYFKRVTYNFNNSFSSSWNPDGKLIVANQQVNLQDDNVGYGQLTIINTKGNIVKQLTSYTTSEGLTEFTNSLFPGTYRGDCTPSWSPDGLYVAYAGQDSNSIYQVFIINIATGIKTQLTSSTTNNNLWVAWQPKSYKNWC